jgi:hypothetical protein
MTTVSDDGTQKGTGRKGEVQVSGYALSSGTDTAGSGSAMLLAMARPDIYRINAFRALELPVTASPRTVSSQMQKLDLLERLGDNGHKGRSLLSLTPAPDSDARREANQRLSDPESRLVDELFWFWPLWGGQPEGGDDALAAMNRNDFSGAVSIWKQHEGKSSEANVSMHNLAVLYHALALDLEYAETTQALTNRQSEQKRSYWEQAFPRWHILLNHEGFWQRLTERIRELDDPRLTTGTARRIRAGLPSVLLSINAKLAVQAAQKSNKSEVMYHVGLMDKSGFDKAVVDEALRSAVTPMRERIKIICANAENETNRDPEHADDVTRNVIEQTSQLLSTVDMLLDKQHPTREAMHDQVALQILSSQIPFAAKTDNWRVSLELVEQALQIAASVLVRRRMEENLQVIKSNLEYGICFFCQRHPAEDKAAVDAKMHGDVTHTGSQIRWRYTTVKVPRCKQCKSVHDRATNIVGVGLFAALVLAILVGVVAHNGWLGLGTFVVCAILAFVASQVTKPAGIKSADDYKEFAGVKNLTSQGWGFGEKPPGAP